MCNMQMDPNANAIGTNQLNMDGSAHIDMKSGASIIFTASEYHHGVYILFLMGMVHEKTGEINNNILHTRN